MLISGVVHSSADASTYSRTQMNQLNTRTQQTITNHYRKGKIKITFFFFNISFKTAMKYEYNI